MSYDSFGVEPYSKGRVVKTETNNDDNPDVDVIETYKYDKYGRTIEKTIQVLDYNATRYTTRYEYDDAGNVRKVTYPFVQNAVLPVQTLSGALTGVFEAETRIETAGATVLGGATLFRAGREIELRPGFETQGKPFETAIEPPTGIGGGASLFELVYSYTSLGQLHTIGTPATPTRFAAYTYNADGGLANEQLNNRNPSFNTTYNYDVRGRLTAFSNGFFSQRLSYDAYFNSNLSKTEFTYGAGLSSLSNEYSAITYDRLGRLTSADNLNNAYDVGVQNALLYDRNGNIGVLQRGTQPSVTYNYAPNTNKVQTVGTGSYLHDLNGNMTQSPKTSIAYDPFHQLATTLSSTGGDVKLHYNAADERVLKTQGSVATLYLHGLSDYPLTELTDDTLDALPAMHRQYIYGLGGLVATIDNGGTRFVFKDHLGSTRVVVSSDGTSGIGYSYDALGNVIAQSAFGAPTSAIAYQYTGQEYDDQTGLHNFRARRFNVQ